MSFQDLLELDRLARQDGKGYTSQRYLYSRLASRPGRHFVGIVGPRGVGKTVLLKQLASESSQSFYLSLDTLEDSEGGDLFEIAKRLVERYGVKLLLVDEIHFDRKFHQKLKAIYDFLDLRIVFTSSVALALFESAYDLSRRVQLETLYPFSFREYVYFKTEKELPRLSLHRIASESEFGEYLRYEDLFEDYIRGGLMPFSLEEPDVLPVLANIIQTVIRRDIPEIAQLRTDEVASLGKVLNFVGRSAVDGVNYSSVSRNVGITKYKAEQYIRLLEKAFLLNPVFPAGTNVLREPKVLMYPPVRLLYRDYPDVLGGLREDFFTLMLRIQEAEFNYLKSTRGSKIPDFLVREREGSIVVEIGGSGKGHEQFKGISEKKRLILTHSDRIDKMRKPLVLAGFL